MILNKPKKDGSRKKQSALEWARILKAREYGKAYYARKRLDPEWVRLYRISSRKKAITHYNKNRERILKRNKTPEVQEYKRLWSKKYRAKNPELARAKNNKYPRIKRFRWLRENGPCQRCGSSKRLELDHINPETKIHHSIWTWSKERREKELTKCQVLCFLCHRLKTCMERGWELHGEIRYQMGCRCKKCMKAHKKKLRSLSLRRKRKVKLLVC